MIQVAVIGAGRHSRGQHGPALRQYAEERPSTVDLAAVCDLDGERARQYAADFGFERVYEDVDRLLDEAAPDAVVAVTPISATRTVVGRVLEARIPVLLEKPPGRTAEEARELLRIARREGTPTMVSFNRRFHPTVSRAREWLATEAADPPDVTTGRLARVGRLEESFVTGTGIHAVDAVLSFGPRPTAVACRRWRATADGGDSAEARLTFDDGRTAHVLLAPAAGEAVERYTLWGPGYTVDIDVLADRLAVARDGERVVSWTAPDGMPAHVGSGAMAETRQFLEAVAAGEGYAPTLQEGALSLQVAEAIDAGGDHDISPPE